MFVNGLAAKSNTSMCQVRLLSRPQGNPHALGSVVSCMPTTFPWIDAGMDRELH
jgi:hypothetical protein